MRRLAIVSMMAAMLGSLPAAAEFVVLSSTQASVAAGSVIADDQKVTLAANKTVQLIDQAGRTITLNGPYDDVVKAEGGKGESKLVRALSSLIREYEQDARSVGAIRATDKKRIEDTITSKESAMVVNISETGDYCFFPGALPKIVRYHSEKSPKVTLTAIANGATHTFDWPSDTVKAGWPDPMPTGDGARFLVSQEGKDSKTLITLHEIPDGAPTVAHLAIALTGQECIEQARLMLVHLRRASQ